METEKLYLQDCYKKDMIAKVIEIIDEKYIVLDKTVFYPTGGGQPHDIGILKDNNHKVNVINVFIRDDMILHELNSPSPFRVGDTITGIIDWKRRYILMRYHTAAHVLSELLERENDTLISGNQLYLEKARLDFTLDNFDREHMLSFAEKVNVVVKQSLPIKKYFLTREDAEQDTGLFTLLKGFPEHIKMVRVVEIEGFDKTACGGTHLDNTKEIGGIAIQKLENKGKQRRRIVFTLLDE